MCGAHSNSHPKVDAFRFKRQTRFTAYGVNREKSFDALQVRSFQYSICPFNHSTVDFLDPGIFLFTKKRRMEGGQVVGLEYALDAAHSGWHAL